MEGKRLKKRRTNTLYSGVLIMSLLAGCAQEDATKNIEQNEIEQAADVSAEDQKREEQALIIEKNITKLMNERGYEAAMAFFESDIIQSVDKELQPTQKTIDIYNLAVQQYIENQQEYHQYQIDDILKSADEYLNEDVEAMIFEKFSNEIAEFERMKEKEESEKQVMYENNKAEREAKEAMEEAQRIEESKNRLYIGMTDAEVLATSKWNKPDDINRTINAYGTSEQWIYDDFDTYLYFDDGRLTTIQE